jgi:DNA-binding XRE family transcriptional regulator
MVCGFCKGAGHVSPEANARWQKGRALRDARVKAGLTQREQAYVLGINWIDLNDVEHGRRAMEDVPLVHHARE